MPRPSKGPEPINLVFVVIGLYVLGYINPDTREAFFWAGLIVAALVLIVGLMWFVERSVAARKAKQIQAPQAEAQPVLEREPELEEALD